jgi:hypothetical protein
VDDVERNAAFTGDATEALPKGEELGCAQVDDAFYYAGCGGGGGRRHDEDVVEEEECAFVAAVP